MQPLQPLLHLLLGPLRFGNEAVLDKLRYRIERLLQLRLADATEGFVQLLREQRLGGLGVLHDRLRLLQHVVERRPLLAELVFEIGPVLRLSQRGLRLLRLWILQLLAQLVFALRELAGLVAKVAHRVGKTGRGLLTELLVQFLQFAFGPRGGTQRLRKLSFAELLGGVELPLTGLFQLLPRLGKLVLPLRLSHAVAQLVGVLQKLLLLFAEPLELPIDLVLFFPRLGSTSIVLQFLKFLGEVGLASGQFAQPVEKVQVLLLGRIAVRWRRTAAIRSGSSCW